jgi:ribosomal protein L7/L12
MKLICKFEFGITSKRLTNLGFVQKVRLYSEENVWVLGTHITDSGHIADTITYNPHDKTINKQEGSMFPSLHSQKVKYISDIKDFLKSNSYEYVADPNITYDFYLLSPGPKNLLITKMIRDHFGIRLTDGIKLVKSAPSLLKQNLDKQSADYLTKIFTDAGATVQFK